MFQHFVYNGISTRNQLVQVMHFQIEDLSQSGGGNSELITFKNNRTTKWRLSSVDYTEPLQFTIQLVNREIDTPIDSLKERHLNRWLLGNKNEYGWLQIESDDYMDIQFRCKFVNPQRLVIGETYGMQYTIICDAPWGYSPIKYKTINSTENNRQLFIDNDSDDLGYIYPKITITVNENCNLKIENSSEDNNRYFLLNNLKKNEVVVIDNENQIISTNNSTHQYILGDFNKHWLRLLYGDNYLTFSNDCTVEMEYRTVRKVGAL